MTSGESCALSALSFPIGKRKESDQALRGLHVCLPVVMGDAHSAAHTEMRPLPETRSQWSLSHIPARDRIHLIRSPEIYNLQVAAPGPSRGLFRSDQQIILLGVYCLSWAWDGTVAQQTSQMQTVSGQPLVQRTQHCSFPPGWP